MKLKYPVALSAAILSCLFVIGCSSKNLDVRNWSTFSPVPFSGYICGFEKTKTLMQLPFFYSSTSNLTVQDITQINLLGKEIVLPCDVVNISQPKSNDEYGYSLSTLSFRVNLPENGQYMVNAIEIVLRNEEIISRGLGEIHFATTTQINNDYPMFATKLMLNQANHTELKIAYKNESMNPVTLTSLTLQDEMYTGFSIKKYVDFDLSQEEDGLVIPAGETRTFLFTLFPDSNYFIENKEYFLYLLPLLSFESDGISYNMPAQTQATVVQPPFKPEYVLNLLSHESN